MFGLGGVGKTQIVTEYAYRFVNEYEMVWWVRSDQEDSRPTSRTSASCSFSTTRSSRTSCANGCGTLRQFGRYDEALAHQASLLHVFGRVFGPDQIRTLNLRNSITIDLRFVGRFVEALEFAGEIYYRCVEYAREKHRTTLVMAANLACDRRIIGDLVEADALGEETALALERIIGSTHPYTLAAPANLAIVLRSRGDSAAASELD